MIPFKGRNFLKQYLPKKPTKWGFKVITRTSSSGIVHDFHVYCGKLPADEDSIGACGDLVLLLCKSLPDDMNFKLYCDRFYMSLRLIDRLKERYAIMFLSYVGTFSYLNFRSLFDQFYTYDRSIWCIGTIMANRLHGCTMKGDKQLAFRGDFDYATECNSGIVAVKWKDTATVTLVSSFVGPEPCGEISRWSAKDRQKVKIPCPQIVLEYNKHMGGVDLSDMLNSLYRVEHKSSRWYLRIVFYVLSTALVNSWLLSRRDKQTNGRDEFPLLDFALEIAEGLCNCGKSALTPPRKRGRPPQESPSPTTTPPPPARKKRAVFFLPATDSRYDQVGHYPIFASRMRCRLCKNGYTQWRCRKCDTYLCLNRHKNCFYEFHKK